MFPKNISYPLGLASGVGLKGRRSSCLLHWPPEVLMGCNWVKALCSGEGITNQQTGSLAGLDFFTLGNRNLINKCINDQRSARAD